MYRIGSGQYPALPYCKSRTNVCPTSGMLHRIVSQQWSNIQGRLLLFVVKLNSLWRNSWLNKGLPQKPVGCAICPFSCTLHTLSVFCVLTFWIPVTCLFPSANISLLSTSSLPHIAHSLLSSAHVSLFEVLFLSESDHRLPLHCHLCLGFIPTAL